MAVRVRATLVAFPQISVLGLNVAIQSSSDDQVAQFLEFLVFRVRGSKHGFNETISSLLHTFEQNPILHNAHLDDLGQSVSQPTSSERSEKVSVGDRDHGRVEVPKRFL